MSQPKPFTAEEEAQLRQLCANWPEIFDVPRLFAMLDIERANRSSERGEVAWVQGADGKWRWRGMAGFSAVVRSGPPGELQLGPQWAVVTPYGVTGSWTFAPTVAEACTAAEQDVTSELDRAARRASNGIGDPPARPSKSDALAKISWQISEIAFELRLLRVPGEPGDHDDLSGCLSLISRWLLERSREESE